jgi:hypothetical protein
MFTRLDGALTRGTSRGFASPAPFSAGREEALFSVDFGTTPSWSRPDKAQVMVLLHSVRPPRLSAGAGN